jgi:hypothetical protein
LTEERILLLLSIERLARYLLRSPVALGRMRLDAPAGEVRYLAKVSDTAGPRERTFERNEFLARLLQHVPGPLLPALLERFASSPRGRRRAGSRH